MFTRRFLLFSLVFLLAPAALLGLLYLWVAIRSPRPDADWLVRTAQKKMVWAGEPVQVTLHINGDHNVPGAVRTQAQSYVVGLAIDHSSSMGSGYGSALEEAKSAAAMFVRSMTSAQQPVAAIGFDEGVTEVCAAGTAGDDCADKVQNIPAGGGTNIAKALAEIHRIVQATLRSGKYPNAKGLIILLSDGGSEHSSAIAAADAAKSEGIRIASIGLGSSIDETLLKSVASTEADFHSTLDPTLLGEIYTSIQAGIGPTIGQNATLVEQFHYGAFELRRQPSGFRPVVDAARGRIEMHIPSLFPRRMSIPYVLKPLKVGLWGLALREATLTYVPDEGRPGTIATQNSGLTPPILVVSPLLLFLLWLPLLLYWIQHFLQKPPPDVRVSEPPPILSVPSGARLPLRRPEPIRPREPQPTLFVGVGAAGGRVVDRLSTLLTEDRYLGSLASPPFKLVKLDARTDDAAASPQFAADRIPLPWSMGRVVRQLQDVAVWPPHLSWLPRADVAISAGAQLDLSKGANGRRWLPRLSLFHAFASKDPAFLAGWERAVEWLNGNRGARIVLVSSLESGTGSGTLADAAHLLRWALPPSVRSEHHVYAACLADVPAEHAFDRANQQAFLEELDRLTVAAHVPQPAVYDPEPPGNLAYLNGAVDEPIFDRVFLIHNQSSNASLVDRDLLYPVASFLHTLSERSFADSVEQHLANMRTREQLLQTRQLEGAVSTMRQHLIRFPAAEIRRRLACRFVMETVGPNRLVGVEAQDARRFSPPPPLAGGLTKATDLWQSLTPPELEKAALYQAYVQAAASNARAAVPALRAAAKTEPALPAFRQEMSEFAARWFYLFLNGIPGQNDAERAAWRVHKISRLHEVLSELVAYDTSVIAAEGGRSSADSPLQRMLGEIQRFHRECLDQTRQWLQALIDPEVVSPAGSNPAALYRSANDEFQEIGQRLAAENTAPWQTVLLDGDLEPEFREDALYQRFFEPVLQQTQGFLLQWMWDVAIDSATATPRLQLRVTTDEERTYQATASGMEALRVDLHHVANTQMGDLDRIGVLETLSGPGGLNAGALARLLSQYAQRDFGLQYDPQYPGSEHRQRHVFAMVPAIDGPAVKSLEAELRRILSCPVAMVRHGDPHLLRFLMVESVIPIAAARLRKPPAGATLPYVLVPEQEAERLREDFERELGRQCPPLHPLVRLLAASERPRSEWIGVLAEDCIEEATGPTGRLNLLISAGGREESVLFDHQGASWIWAAINLAYGLRANSIAPAALASWAARPTSEQIERLRKEAARWYRRAEESGETPEGPILRQIAMLIELEAKLRDRKRREARAS